jgi:hypothetical protein
MRRTLTFLAAVAVAALLLLAGCGGDKRLSKDDYQKQMMEKVGAFVAATGKIDEATSSDSPRDVKVKALKDGRKAFDDAADDLDDLSPPEDVEEAHDLIVSGLRKYADYLEEPTKALEAGDEQRARDLLSADPPFAGDFDRATQIYTDKGYTDLVTFFNNS